MSIRFSSVAYEILFAHVAQVSRASLFAREPVLSLDQQKQWATLSARLAKGEPLHYILGYRPFYDLDIPVDARVLIPRQETELLVDAVVAWARTVGIESPRILDLGTGSGCISFALAKALPRAQITASDVSADAIARVQESKGLFKWADRIQCVQGDLLEPFQQQPFDCIVTNLPYIGSVEHAFVENAVRRFEPAFALFAGDDGLVLYKRFFAQLAGLSWKPRVVYGEYGDTQRAMMESLLKEFFPSCSIAFHKDLAGFDRYFSLTFPL